MRCEERMDFSKVETPATARQAQAKIDELKDPTASCAPRDGWQTPNGHIGVDGFDCMLDFNTTGANAPSRTLPNLAKLYFQPLVITVYFAMKCMWHRL